MYIVKKVMRAVRGMGAIFAAERSMQIELLIALAVIALVWRLGASRLEMVLVVAAVFGVVVLEGLNTVLERVIDLAEPRYRDSVREIKDAMAGLVLLAAFAALAAVLLVLWPYIVPLHNSGGG